MYDDNKRGHSLFRLTYNIIVHPLIHVHINIIHFTTGNERASRNDDTIEYDNSIRRGSVELWRSRRSWLKRMPTITATEWPILLKRSRQSISIISFAVHS